MPVSSASWAESQLSYSVPQDPVASGSKGG